MPVILGLPKGSLQEATFNMLRKAGFSIKADARSYVPRVDDPDLQCRLIRPQEISRYVELGLLDAGITGFDWIYENNSDVREVAEMCYSKATSRPVRWVLAVPNSSTIQSVKDLNGKRIATEAVGLTRRYLEQHGVEAEVEFSWGATEVKAPELVDAIVELTETGSSLRANDLRIVDTILTSTTRLIANRKAWEVAEKRAKITQIAMLLQGALAAEARVLLKLNVPSDKLDEITAILPSLHAPTVNKLHNAEWYAVESVVEEKVVRDIIPPLRSAGAEGIIELPLNKVIF
ncbi:MAG: ATP phosphoribosyltransferase [Kiritimatiellae bacterium]|nr:ATP phosphoribosyltransferase [Kiritimatiellia bacterium]MDD3544865.1 ATP phosphoribosyltransferase [Kiritimatiellia bacterium]MDD4024346.1 ATP phosphoribosyltransferase [Kiritimatiellia bacterium]MDD4622573.1 ATP phosphoribosyltransferase [Kiritimatiellia bacterium]